MCASKIKLRRCVDLINNKENYQRTLGDYVGLEHIRSWTGGVLIDKNADPRGAVSRFQNGDVLFGKLRPYLAKVVCLRFDGVCSAQLLVFRPRKNAFNRYIMYAISTSDFINRVSASSYGATMPQTSWESIGSERIALPDISSQREIVDFLDQETVRIDLLIEKKERLLSLIKEKIKTETKNLVFRLNEIHSTQDFSLTPDFRSYPKHWDLLRCAQIFENLDHKRVPLSAEERDNLDRIYPYYGASGIIDAVDRYLLDEETILVGEDGANLILQSKPVAFKAEGKYWVNNHAHILKPRFGNIDYWIDALNQIPFEVYVTGSAQPKLTAMALNNIRLPVPPAEEQFLIAERIKSAKLKIDFLIDPVRQTINLLREYRAALITAAIAGQIDVKACRRSGQVERQSDKIQRRARA